MGHSYIKWISIEINDEDFDSSTEVIELNSDNSLKAASELKQNHPEVFNALFSEIDINHLKLNIPYSGYLGTNSTSENEQVLKAFFDNNDAPLTDFQLGQGFEKKKLIYLSREKLDPNIYELFASIICEVNDGDEEYGYLSLVFDDSQGYVASDGEQEWEPNITIDDNGGCWY